MSSHFVRVDLSRSNAQFRPITIVPGTPLLDRPGGLTHYTIARQWLGDLIAEPRWGSRGISYFIRSKDNQRLVGVRCAPLRERDARRKVVQAEMEKLRALLARVKPEPDEAALLAALRQSFEELRAGTLRTRQGDSLFKYRDAYGKLRLVWAWGYNRKDLCPGSVQICPKCAALFVKPADKPLACAACGWRPPARRWAAKILATAALVLIALGLGSWWPNWNRSAAPAAGNVPQASRQLAQSGADPDQQHASGDKPEASPATSDSATSPKTDAQNSPALASSTVPTKPGALRDKDSLLSDSAKSSGTSGSAAKNADDPKSTKPNPSTNSIAGSAPASAVSGAPKTASTTGSPSHAPTSTIPSNGAAHAPLAAAGSGHGLGSGGSGVGGSVGIAGSASRGNAAVGGAAHGGAGFGTSGFAGPVGGLAHPSAAGTFAGHASSGFVAGNGAAFRPPLAAAAGNHGGYRAGYHGGYRGGYHPGYHGVTRNPAFWNGIAWGGVRPYRNGASTGAETYSGYWHPGDANWWGPGATLADWVNHDFLPGVPTTVAGGPGPVVLDRPVQGVTAAGVGTLPTHTVVAAGPYTAVVDSIPSVPATNTAFPVTSVPLSAANVSLPASNALHVANVPVSAANVPLSASNVSVAAAPVTTTTGSAGSWFQSVQALNAAQTDTGVQLELEVQGENQVGGLEYRLAEPGDNSDLDWYPARQNGVQTRVVLLSPKLSAAPSDGMYRLVIQARNTSTHEQAQFPYVFRVVLGVHPETANNAKL